MSAPKLRFKEFSGDWNNYQINDISTVTSGGTPSRSNSKFWDNGTIPWITTSLVDFNIIKDANEFITEEGLNNSSAKIFSKNTILIAMYGQGVTRGKVAILGIEATTNQACAAITLKPTFNTTFIFQNIMNRYEEIRELSNDGGQKNLSAAIIKNININCPSKPEQTKIATFLTAVDEKISQLSQKQELLTQYKKGMMQKLFSQQIRFKADDGSEFGEWEEKLLNDITQITMGSSPKSENYNENQLGLPLLQGNADIKNRLSHPRIFTSEITKKCNIGDILLSVRAPVGFVALSKHNACIGRGLASIRAKTNINQGFIYQVLLLKETKWASLSQGSTFESVNSEQIKNLNIHLPTLPEQTKIANFLSAIDQKIDLTTQQLEQAKQWKKGLLQQMFI
ncbi:restriction endonuclease subunit S [Acinetobacter sp. ESL0695]|uniref:restriction endonuclease subunit S n=1 Tax=Acinetobacter sp. ESL0695 TaxID=2983215 RepID=UPI0023F2C4CB|nr:restriction endonuclease subunit S [Acinetobacter sp. ESL0695]WEV49788.1 restriction endonuclease subunit S [Acinetobacter sp. ESL0695]